MVMTKVLDNKMALVNLVHFVTTISTLLRRYVMEIVMNLVPLKCHFTCYEKCKETKITSQE
jgi:hypothetical protein